MDEFPHNDHDVVARVGEVYMRLIDETENKQTYQNKKKHDQLHALLEVIEYIRTGEDNPLDNIFYEEQ